jgi:hypothetical protein
MGHIFFGMFLGLIAAIIAGLPAFLFWRRYIDKNPFKYTGVSRWSGFRKKTPAELQMENAKKLLSEGAHGMAENEYRSLLEKSPDNLEAHSGLAESLFEQAIKGLRKDPIKRKEALEQFQWILDHYLRGNKPDKAAVLYKRLLGPYTAEEIGEGHQVRVEGHVQKTGDVIVQDSQSYLDHRKKLQDDFSSVEGAGKYREAHSVLNHLLLKSEIHQLDPSFLARAGEVCLRVQDIGLAERIFESVAKRGDLKLTVRALEVLSRYWLKTPRQPELSRLYLNSSDRFIDLNLFPEWVELGHKLKG